jgi:hypothetical protein
MKVVQGLKRNYDMFLLVDVGLWVVMLCGLAGRYQYLQTSGLKMEAKCSSKTLLSTLKSTKCYSPDD